jgi:hypothetical protein
LVLTWLDIHTDKHKHLLINTYSYNYNVLWDAHKHTSWVTLWQSMTNDWWFRLWRPTRYALLKLLMRLCIGEDVLVLVSCRSAIIIHQLALNETRRRKDQQFSVKKTRRRRRRRRRRSLLILFWLLFEPGLALFYSIVLRVAYLLTNNLITTWTIFIKYCSM